MLTIIKQLVTNCEVAVVFLPKFDMFFHVVQKRFISFCVSSFKLHILVRRFLARVVSVSDSKCRKFIANVSEAVLFPSDLRSLPRCVRPATLPPFSPDRRHLFSEKTKNSNPFNILLRHANAAGDFAKSSLFIGFRLSLVSGKRGEAAGQRGRTTKTRRRHRWVAIRRC